MSVGIFFGSSTGHAEEVASKIAQNLGVDADVINVAEADAAKISSYDKLICGSSTWGSGDLQDDWDSFDFSALEVSGKTVALFGLGDSDGYGDTYCDALGKLYFAFKDKGAKIVGATSTDGYTFDSSEAVVDGKFAGLAIDESQDDQTDDRIASWCDAIRSEFA